jgi:hypothetical protein
MELLAKENIKWNGKIIPKGNVIDAAMQKDLGKHLKDLMASGAVGKAAKVEPIKEASKTKPRAPRVRKSDKPAQPNTPPPGDEPKV